MKNPLPDQTVFAAIEEIVHLNYHAAIVPRVPAEARRVLDLGCGSGSLGSAIKERLPLCEVIGITISPGEGRECAKRLDHVLVKDLHEYDFRELGDFDCVICSGILGYFMQPEHLLTKAADCLRQREGTLIVMHPNILKLPQRIDFLRGRFHYASGSVLDKFSVRFFDYNSIYTLVQGSGFVIEERTGEGHFPLLGVRRLLGPLASSIDRIAVRLNPGLFADEAILVGHPSPSVRSNHTIAAHL
ncbi:MAG: class I SAM-dependent methyltransferase [Armatimonadota bacterium]